MFIHVETDATHTSPNDNHTSIHQSKDHLEVSYTTHHFSAVNRDSFEFLSLNWNAHLTQMQCSGIFFSEINKKIVVALLKTMIFFILNKYSYCLSPVNLKWKSYTVQFMDHPLPYKKS